MKRLILGSLLITLMLSACAPATAPLAMAERQQVGDISFQLVEGYSIDNDETGGIYINSPDGEIGVIMQVAPSSSFVPEMTPSTLGGQFPEEGFPVAMMLFLGFEDITLARIETYRFGDYSGYKRNFSATNFSDTIEGEYVFFPLGDQTLIAMGSVISQTGNNQWIPNGKAAFDAIVHSIQYP